LQNKIELARREQQLVEQSGANAQRKAELETQAQLVRAQGQAEQERALAQAKADAVRVIGLAEGEAESARLAAYRDLPPHVLQSLALKEFAGKLPEIGQLTVTPDVVTGLLAKFNGNASS
jgi:regulator of protease activity HflC (stomatin/prohibitin superfamily)